MKGLKQARKNRGFSQRDLATIMEVTDQTISNWECGQRTPDVYVIMHLCRVLKCEPKDLMGGNKDGH